MAELDFDELDKAVSDLMVNVDTSKQPAGLDEHAETVVTIPSSDTSKPATLPVSPGTPQTPSSGPQSGAATPSAPAAPSLATKRRGQFMDIVHPSLNMTTGSPKFSNRHGTTLKPSSGAESLASEQRGEVPAPVPVEQAASAPTEGAPQSAWPDPIDMAAGSTVPTDTVPADNLSTASAEDTSSDSTEPAPLSSPFLSDTKVEKRPLGGVSPDLGAQPEASPAKSEAVASAPVVSSKVLPAEFGGDIMAAESKDLSSHPEAAKVLAAPMRVAAAPVSEAKTLSSNGSISPQYTEKPSSGDQSNGSIYDTATYHQAIDADKPKKKPSPLKWIIWIVVLLLVGAAAGAAYYFATR